MCGRYTLTTPLDGLRALFDFPERPNLARRANIAPTQQVLVVRGGAGRARHASTMRWGLVPRWAKDLSIGAKMINARAESLSEKPAYRQAFACRHCLIVADGFYEWQAREAGGKQPFRIARTDGRPFAFAGLWESWHGPEAAAAPAIESCTIVTTAANALLRPIHARMPVLLFDAPEFDTWLDPQASPAALDALLGTRDTTSLIAYPVSPRVNKVANDDLSLLDPIVDEAPSKVVSPTQPTLL